MLLTRPAACGGSLLNYLGATDMLTLEDEQVESCELSNEQEWWINKANSREERRVRNYRKLT